MIKFSTCLWFDTQAGEASEFYQSVFKNTKIGNVARYPGGGEEIHGGTKGQVLTVEMEIEGQKVLLLNGGPIFKHTPSMSFIDSCESEAESDELWKKLSPGGTVRMGLDKYPWASKYGWTADKYGVEWQIMNAPGPQKIAPALLFVDERFGKGEEAVNFYTSMFPNSKIESMHKDEQSKTVAHASFNLNGQNFRLMEGAGKHGHQPNESFSICVHCDTQEEVDKYWDKFTKDGAESQCGWVKDKFGVSWQIIPNGMGELMSNPKTAAKAMKVMLTMKKLDINKLRAAANS